MLLIEFCASWMSWWSAYFINRQSVLEYFFFAKKLIMAIINKNWPKLSLLKMKCLIWTLNCYLIIKASCGFKNEICLIYWKLWMSKQNPDVAKNLVDNWIPRCYRQSTPCYSTLQFVHCMPNPYYQAEGFQNTSISE